MIKERLSCNNVIRAFIMNKNANPERIKHWHNRKRSRLIFLYDYGIISYLIQNNNDEYILTASPDSGFCASRFWWTVDFRGGQRARLARGWPCCSGRWRSSTHSRGFVTSSWSPCRRPLSYGRLGCCPSPSCLLFCKIMVDSCALCLGIRGMK